MVHLTSKLEGSHISSIPLAIGLLISVSALVALCAKHVRNSPKKQDTKTINSASKAPKSPLASPRHLLTTFSNKAIPFIYRKKGGEETDQGGGEVGEGFGEGGLWQKEILMGEKCKPPEFSGVIYYDCCGNRVSEMPRSPRVSPLPTFKYNEAKDVN